MTPPSKMMVVVFWVNFANFAALAVRWSSWEIGVIAAFSLLVAVCGVLLRSYR